MPRKHPIKALYMPAVLLVLPLPANPNGGRDFIVGDLHGCYDLLQQALFDVGFDYAKDRLFSVGDLADRGPSSMDCLRLLKEPWFYAVRGNHEDMLVDYMHGCDYNNFLSNGGTWVKRLTKEEHYELEGDLLPLIEGLPYVITVGTGEERFNVVHADLLAGQMDMYALFYGATQSKPAQKERVLTDAEITEDQIQTMLADINWSRALINRVPKNFTEVTTPVGTVVTSEQSWHPGLSLTYVGHTPMRELVLHASHFYIDQGAFSRSAGTQLTLVEHAQVLSWKLANGTGQG
jgi:serine/threonine protein phosphatase 1